MDWASNGIFWFLGVVVGVIGHDRIRRWIRLDEPEPYYVSAQTGGAFDNDPTVGPIAKAAVEDGNTLDWIVAHEAPTKEHQGFEYLRVNRQKIVFRSNTLAHGEAVVLMVRRS